MLRKLPGALGAFLVIAMLTAGSAMATPFTVKTEPASNIGAYKVQFNGAYFGQGASGWYGFEYGTTTAYGSESDRYEILPYSSGWISAPGTVEGLQPETTYHFRFGAMTLNGEVSYGADRTFTTRSVPRFEASEYTANVSSQQQGSDPVIFSTEAGKLKCTSVTASGSMPAATSSLKLTPSFPDASGCEFRKSNGQELFAEAEVAVNGCQFIYHPGDSGGPTTTMDIACTEGRSIEVTTGTCKFSIGSQSGLGMITSTLNSLTNPDTIDMNLNVSGFKYTKIKDAWLCPFIGTGTAQDGGISGSQALSASAGDLKIGY